MSALLVAAIPVSLFLLTRQRCMVIVFEAPETLTPTPFPQMLTRSKVPLFVWLPLTRIPWLRLLLIRVSATKSALLPVVRVSATPRPLPPRKPKITQFSMETLVFVPPVILTPTKPVPAPLMEMLRSWTQLLTPGVETFTLTPLVPDAKIEPHPFPSIVMDLTIVTAPKPPGSSASISPSVAVFEMAPAKVLQGAVRLQGLASSPTPETQVRVACAWVIEANANVNAAIARTFIVNRNLFIWSLLFSS